MKLIKSLVFALVSLCATSAYANGWIPFYLENNHITIDVEFNGQPSKAILDSGAEIHMVSNHYIEKYGEGITEGKQILIKGANGTSRTDTYNRIPIKLFGIDTQFNQVPAGNLGGPSILLGAPFFKRFLVQIDYPNQKMRLLPKSAIKLGKHENVAMKRERGSILPAVKVLVNGKKLWLTMDTGNNSGLFIKRNYLEENGFLEGVEVKKSRSRGLNKEIITDTFSIDGLKFGPFDLDGVLVATPAEGEASIIGGRDSDLGGFSHIKSGVQTKGILGYDILKHFVLTIDYSKYKMHIGLPED